MYSPHYEKFQIYNLLKEYDRIIYVDIDVIINETCPDLFQIVPEKDFGIAVDSNRLKNYKNILSNAKLQLQALWGNVN